jgi:hypothetical protein
MGRRKGPPDLGGPAQQLLPKRHIEEPERNCCRCEDQHPHRTTLKGAQREDCTDEPYGPEDVDPGTRNHQAGNHVRKDANDEVREKANNAQDSLGPNSLGVVRLRSHGREATFQPISAPVAQWIERRRPKAGVGGSTPSGRTRDAALCAATRVSSLKLQARLVSCLWLVACDLRPLDQTHGSHSRDP